MNRRATGSHPPETIKDIAYEAGLEDGRADSEAKVAALLTAAEAFMRPGRDLACVDCMGLNNDGPQGGYVDPEFHCDKHVALRAALTEGSEP